MLMSQRNQQFLSSNAQDFIEDNLSFQRLQTRLQFLSSNAQDFIEERMIAPISAVCSNS